MTDIREKVEEALHKIYSELETEGPGGPPGLLSGRAGKALFKFHYLTYFGAPDVVERMGDEVQLVAEGAVACPIPTFCSGTSGIRWFYRYLVTSGLLDEEDYSFLKGEDAFTSQALTMLDKGNYDFLHGAVGLGHEFLLDTERPPDGFFSEFLSVLAKLKERSASGGIVPAYNFVEDYVEPFKVNLSLSHGLASILKFCLECFNADVCRRASGEMAWNLISYLMERINDDTDLGYFPGTVDERAPQPGGCRMAWCYGDLGIGYVLYLAGIAFGDVMLVDFAMEVLRHATQRRDFRRTGVYDAAVCHGAAGIAHIFGKAGHLTGDPHLKEAAEFWIRKTLDMGVHSDVPSGYKKYNALNDTFEKETGLLEGSAGIGLVLLSHLTGDFRWDACLMLNT